MNEKFSQLKSQLDRAYALEAACTLFNWDQYNAPKGSIENTAKIIGTLSGEHYRALINDDVRRLLEELSTDEGLKDLSFHERSILKLLNKQFHKLSLIPPKEYEVFSALIARHNRIW